MPRPVAVVPGASRGIGRQLCFDLAAAGYELVCVAPSTDQKPSKLPGTVGQTAGGVLDLENRVAVNGLRIDTPIWSEGYRETLGGEGGSAFEDAVIVSDAVLWLAGRPLAHTAEIHTLSGLRERGIVRPPTR